MLVCMFPLVVIKVAGFTNCWQRKRQRLLPKHIIIVE